MSFNPGINLHLSSLCRRYCLRLLLSTDATSSLKSFSDSASHLNQYHKTKLQNICSGPKPLDMIVHSGISRQLCLPWQFIIMGWSMSFRPITPYRPRLCSHGLYKTDIERQAPDTRHQAPYIPDTCFVCVIIRHRHLDLTIS